MKRSTFLKTILALVVMIVMAIGLTSCEQKKSCEKNHTGDVTIYNNCNFRIVVDVYSSDLVGDGFAGERSISSGSSVKYLNIPAGPIEIWEDDAYSNWGYWNEYLEVCENFEYEIYSGKGEASIYLRPLDIDKKIKGKRK